MIGSGDFDDSALFYPCISFFFYFIKVFDDQTRILIIKSKYQGIYVSLCLINFVETGLRFSINVV